MPALHVVVRPKVADPRHPRLGVLPAQLEPLHGLLDVVVDGVNLTARVGAGQAVDFLIELAYGLVSVLGRGRASVPLHTDNELWELGLELDGSSVLMSVFSPDPVPTVAAFERRIPIETLASAIDAALEQALDQPEYPRATRAGLLTARRSLRLAVNSQPTARPATRKSVSVSTSTQNFRVTANVALRIADGTSGPGLLERADLHSLLLLGHLDFEAGERHWQMKNSQVFLDAERLLQLSEDALKSWRSATATFRRCQLSTAKARMRRGPGESLVELGFQFDKNQLQVQIECEPFVHGAASFALELAKQIERADKSQLQNLRLRALKEQALQLLEQINNDEFDRSVSNPQPDSYSRFAPRTRRAAGTWEDGPTMRFSPRWVATVPGIDLGGTFLCGDRLVVGGRSETACLDRRSGEVIWKRDLSSAASVVTPSGLVRVEPDGRLSCLDLQSGEARFNLQVLPRRAGRVAGSVMHGPGMPKLLALCEGDRQVSGIDLVSGAVRWRYTARRPAPFSLRRAGRLLLAVGGDPLMVALDGVNGELVWSLRARLPFLSDLALDHDSAFALSGTAGSSHRLHRFNPWSGQEGWSVELEERPLPGQRPLLTAKVIVIPISDDAGAGAAGYCRETGRLLWQLAPGLVPLTSSWLAVDDCIIANSYGGVLVGLNSSDGRTRFTHVFSSSKLGDQPRRFEPVLRSGALFVPQHQVHVVRPRDGELLGTLPSDLIPDLVRVDERCDVYVAEDSGHLAAFGAAPKLALIKG